MAILGNLVAMLENVVFALGGKMTLLWKHFLLIWGSLETFLGQLGSSLQNL